MKNITTIVIGGLNTDIVAEGIKRFPQVGDHVYGKRLHIGPGGKSRNIAQMIAALSGVGSVAMVGRTAKDPYGLWNVPYKALQDAGVDTTFVRVLEGSSLMPGVALIPVDTAGNNQIFVLPGANNDFSHGDIDAAETVFQAAAVNHGMLALSLECPLDTATYAIAKAAQLGMKVILDPGGMQPGWHIDELLRSGVYLIKPNVHEAAMLTGVDVKDEASARMAADKLHQLGIQWVLITAGSGGAYLIGPSTAQYLPTPQVDPRLTAGDRDETGCGDQTMAALCAAIQGGKSEEEAARLAVTAGTLQFYRKGIQPLNPSDLEAILED